MPSGTNACRNSAATIAPPSGCRRSSGRRLRVEIALVGIAQRQRPDRLAGGVAARCEPAPSTPSWLPSTAATLVPSATTCRAGQRREVDDGRGLLPARGDQPVGEDEPALGVGVEHLDRRAVACIVMTSPTRCASPPSMLSVRGRKARTRTLTPRSRAADIAADDRGGAAHVALHADHAFGRLDRQPAGVERDALADERDRCRRLRSGRLIRQLDPAGRLVGTPVHREQAAVARLARSPLSSSTFTRRPTVPRSRWIASANTGGVSEPPGSLTRSRATLTASATRAPRSSADVARAPPPPTTDTLTMRLGFGFDR